MKKENALIITISVNFRIFFLASDRLRILEETVQFSLSLAILTVGGSYHSDQVVAISYVDSARRNIPLHHSVLKQ